MLFLFSVDKARENHGYRHGYRCLQDSRIVAGRSGIECAVTQATSNMKLLFDGMMLCCGVAVRHYRLGHLPRHLPSSGRLDYEADGGAQIGWAP